MAISLLAWVCTAKNSRFFKSCECSDLFKLQTVLWKNFGGIHFSITYPNSLPIYLHKKPRINLIFLNTLNFRKLKNIFFHRADKRIFMRFVIIQSIYCLGSVSHAPSISVFAPSAFFIKSWHLEFMPVLSLVPIAIEALLLLHLSIISLCMSSHS